MTAEAKMKKLVKGMEFTTESEYYEYCVDSYLNGNLSQCERLFKDMPRQNKDDFYKWMVVNETPLEVYRFYARQF
jgi:nucleoid-associated protein YejK